MLLSQRQRKRSWREMIEEEKITLDHIKEIEVITHTLFVLKQKIDKFDDVERQNDEKSQNLAKLYEFGIINKHGELINKLINE